MGKNHESQGQGTSEANRSQSDTLSIPTENVVNIACGSSVFYFDLSTIEEQAGIFQIQPGVDCKYLLCKNKLILETECTKDLAITGKAEGLRYVYISSKGKLVFGLNITNEQLHFRFHAKSVDIKAKIVTKAAGAIFTHDDADSKIVFHKNCTANILALDSAEIKLDNAIVDIAKTYIATEKFVASVYSALLIGNTNNFIAHNDTGDIIPTKIAELIVSKSYLNITNMTGSCNFDVSEAECHFGEIKGDANFYFCRASVFYSGGLPEAPGRKFVLHDSMLHSTHLSVNRSIDVLASDIYTEKAINFEQEAGLRLYGALVCSAKVSINCDVEYLDNNPVNPLDQPKPVSRIISSSELTKGINNFISTIVSIMSEGKIAAVGDEQCNQILERLYKQSHGAQYKTIPAKVKRVIIEKVTAAGLKNINTESIDRIGEEVTQEMLHWDRKDRYVFTTSKHDTARHTSLKHLRDFVEGKTLATNERHLRVLSVPGDGDCVLYSLVISLLYLGFMHNERAKVVDLLSSIYTKHKTETLSLKVYTPVKDEDFEKFISEYIGACYYGHFSEFINNYFDSQSESFVVTRFVSACARLAVKIHAMPKVEQLYDEGNVVKLFTDTDKRQKNYPQLLAEAKEQLKRSLAEALQEFNPQQFINIEYIQAYLDSHAINSTVKYKSGATPLLLNNKNNKLGVTFWESGDNDLTRHYEPEFDLHCLNAIEFSSSIPPKKDDKADILLDMMTICCYYIPGAIRAFGAEYSGKIQARTREIFETESSADEDGSLIVQEKANIHGVNGHLYASGPMLVQSKISIDNCAAVAGAIKVSSGGVLDGSKRLKLQSYSMTKNHGKIMADETKIISDYLISTNAAYIAGKHQLEIQSLIHVLNLSYLYTTSGIINTVFHINTGIMHVWNCMVDALINFDGVTIPCLPRRKSDLCDKGKLFTLFKMGIGALSAEVGFAVQAATRTYTLAQTTKQMYALYGQLKDKNWHEFSRHDTAVLLMQIKRVVNEAYGAYRIAPSVVQLSSATRSVATTVQGINTFQNTKAFAACIKQNGLLASMAASKDKLRDLCQQQIANAGSAIEASKATIKQTWSEKSELRAKLAAQGKWIPSSADIPAGSALKDVVDGARDVAALVLPYKYTDSVLDVRFGFQCTFSSTSQSFLGFDVMLYAINGHEYNQRLFTHFNAESSKHKSYDYHTVCGLDYINYGTIDAVNWNLSARDYIERGTTDAPCKIFDIRRNAYVANHGRMSGMGEVSGTIGGDFTVNGVSQFGGGALRVGGRAKFHDTSEISTNDAVLFAQNLYHHGQWDYSGNLYVELGEHVLSTADSMMRGANNSVATIKSKTEDLNGKGAHVRIFYDIAQMEVTRARDLAYQQGSFADVTSSASIKVTTQATDNVMYSGLRKDGALAELVTNGGVTLDPVTYSRARGDVFKNYNEAASVAANYASYKIPPPPPPSKRRRFWRKVFKEVVHALEVVGAVVSSASTPETLAAGSAIAGVAAGVDQLVKHSERKDNRRIEEGNRRVLEGQQVVNRAILAANQQSANLALIETHAHQSAQMLASGGRINNAHRQSTQQQLAQQQQQLNQDFADFSHTMEQAHAKELYDLRTQNDAIRKHISHSGGPKIGFGAAVNTGSTGTSVSITSTIGSQKPVHSRVEMISIDSGRLRNTPSIEQAKPPQVPLPPIEHTSTYETIEPPTSNTHVYMLDEQGSELKLEPMEDSARARFTTVNKPSGMQQQGTWDGTRYVLADGLRSQPLIEESARNQSFSQHPVSTNKHSKRHNYITAAGAAPNRHAKQTHDSDLKHAAQWLKMAWRAANGETSIEVLEWQQRNRDRHANMAAFSDGLQHSRERQVFESFADGVSDSVKKPIQFLAEEVARLNMQQRTKTMQFAVDVGTFIGHEAARLSLNEQTKSRQFVNHVASVIHEDLNRLRLGQPTVLGSRLLNEFRVLADMSAPELARNLGADLGNALVLYGIGNGLRVANQSANSFIMAHEFRSPVTFRFEAGRLNSGIPFDQVELRNPLVKKTIKSRIKDAQLPTEGKIRFVPPDNYDATMPLRRGYSNGFRDKFGNEWTKGPSRTVGEAFEWDVILSALGKKQLGWASRDGQHLNVSLKGKLTH